MMFAGNRILRPKKNRPGRESSGTRDRRQTVGIVAGTVKVFVEPLESRVLLSAATLLSNLSNPRDFIRAGNSAFFVADNSSFANGELYVTDGTSGHVYSINPLFHGGFVGASLGSSFFYFDGPQLWTSAGPPNSSPTLVKNLQTLDSGITKVSQMAAAGNLVYFVADDGGLSTGQELWQSDGTAAGTHLVADINPGTAGSSPNHLTAIGNELYFDANDGTHGDELWKTDGTAQGTLMVEDAVPGAGSSSPAQLTNVGGTLYLVMTDASGTSSLWKSDGTAAGTVEITSAPSQGIGSFGNLTAVQNELYFTADTSASGVELWKTDGTPSGTQIVDDLNPGPGSSSPKFLQALGATLYFNAFDSSGRGELFRTDGTAASTVQLTSGLTYTTAAADDNAGVRSLTAVDGTLFFAADDGVHGDELWSSDGTAAGTAMVQDIGPGDSLDDSAYAMPQLLSMGTFVLFAANNNQTGNQLWKANSPPQSPPNSISGTFYYDTNGNGVWDSGEQALPYQTVFLDNNGDGIHEAGEPEYTCDSTGQYLFTNVSYGYHQVAAILPANWSLTPGNNSGYWLIKVVTGQSYPNNNFGEVRGVATAKSSAPAVFTGSSLTLNLAYTGFNPVTSWTIDWGDSNVAQTISGDATSASHTYTSVAEYSSDDISVWANSADGSAPAAPMSLQVYDAPVLSNGTLSLAGTSAFGNGYDTVSFADSGGLLTVTQDQATLQYNSSLVSHIAYSDNTGSGNSISLSGAIPADVTFTYGVTTITNDDTAPVHVSVANSSVGGTDTYLYAGAGTTIFTANTGTGIKELAFHVLNISAGAKVVFANSSATLGDYSNHANRNIVEVDPGGLNIASGGTLDLGDSDFALDYAAGAQASADAMISNLLTSGITANGDWSGTGITSSEANYDSNFGIGARALGWADENDLGLQGFDGIGYGNDQQVVVKLTYYGDVDLSGTFNATDVNQLIAGRSHTAGDTGWEYADFDYDGVTSSAQDQTLYFAGRNAYQKFGAL